MSGYLLHIVRMVWWDPILALCILVLGRFGVLRRAYLLVFGHDWYVLSNGGFCRLRLARTR